ncbi:stress-responsive transcriptional activator MSN4 KNAG_0H00550 [Huiozyma naganishii CBS 8797]|uniref:C2H2-type domain-containing protein n=1 Tax=Huiozyma naganishii (strain ATCC MYA-139 / BCRC 22969 / CBS 8797 / KCTC 17520 / NBRC 10181 / NCYC 3082 / Yp74L-3) TaxID=1071383 RepID=J7S9G1_HUIN7|nr:hypothetical protein KNAG_0H00550 [Kazachstania naganishii CBS 8797]CCK71471.1 hypothetical protein KNAG_0H00550 [Kazachstania naganishii CBS 8797]
MLSTASTVRGLESAQFPNISLDTAIESANMAQSGEEAGGTADVSNNARLNFDNTTATDKPAVATPDLNYYLNYSVESPAAATDSSTTPVSVSNSKKLAPNTDSSETNTHSQRDNSSSNNSDNVLASPAMSSPSISSSTTKLNTANSSLANISKLNFRFNYINNNINSLTADDLQELSSPTAMTDLLEMLDSKEIERQSQRIPQQQQQQQLISPHQLVNNRLSTKHNSFLDNNRNSIADIPDQSALDEVLDDFVSNEFDSNDLLFGNSLSETVTDDQFPSLTDTRNSISHNVDFWNMSEVPQARDNSKTDKQATGQGDGDGDGDGDVNAKRDSIVTLNNELSQVLNDYNMNFNEGESTAPTNTERSPIGDAVLRSPRNSYSALRQRSSLPTISSNALFNNLYEGAGGLPSEGTSNGNSAENALFSDTEESDEDKFNLGNSLMTDPIAETTTTQEGKFIKPSMMLADTNTVAAELAMKGISKFETFPTIDPQPYAHPTKIEKRRSISNMPSFNMSGTSGSLVSSSSSSLAGARRKSTIGVIRTPSMSQDSLNLAATLVSLEDKPFKCGQCVKAFKRSEHLKRHVRSVHSNDRPFACTLCEKKFSRSDNLSQHLKTHKKHGDF